MGGDGTEPQQQEFLEERMKTSFRDMVVSDVPTQNATKEDQTGFYSEEEVAQEDDDDLECPMIIILMEDKQMLRAPWKMTLIVKILGYTIGYNYLLRHMKNIWNLKLPFDMIDLPNGYYRVQFTNQSEYNYVLNEGPW